MADIKPEEIDRLAELARLELTPQERVEFADQLPHILGFVEELQGADVDEDSEQEHIEQSQLRPDEESGVNLTVEQLKQLAPDFADDQVVVPPVFKDNDDV